MYLDLAPISRNTIYRCYFKLKFEIAIKTLENLHNPPVTIFLMAVIIYKLMNFQSIQSSLGHPVIHSKLGQLKNGYLRENNIAFTNYRS